MAISFWDFVSIFPKTGWARPGYGIGSSDSLASGYLNRVVSRLGRTVKVVYGIVACAMLLAFSPQ
jgi:hypothetical protein